MPRFRDFIPPACLHYVNRLRGLGFTRLYASAQEAAATCAGNGYATDDLVRVVQLKTARLRDELRAQPRPHANYEYTRGALAVSLALREQGSDPHLHVLDFGGACGAHYFLAKALFRAVPLRWSVVETTAMARAATEAFADDELRFFDSIAAARATLPRYHLIYSSSSLQYLPNPCEALGALVDCEATCIYLTRNGLTSGDRDLFTTQRSLLSANGPGPLPAGMTDRKVEYPVVFTRKAEVEAILGRKYAIALEFEEGTAYNVRGQQIPLIGYFCRLRGGPAQNP